MYRIPFSKVDCSGNELRYVQDVLESGWLTTAGRALELETKFAEALGARFACAVNSCTSALHLALEAIRVGPGDKVLVPTMTFTATAEVIRYLDADPVFLDVEYGSSLLTPEIVDRGLKLYPEAKAVIVVHFGGQAAELMNERGEGILDICHRHGVRVIEDAAHAYPTRHCGRFIGTFGDITCFSFYANKTMTTGEGGMLVTNDEAIFHRVRVMRLHGIDRDIWNRFSTPKPSWEYDVVAPGYKYNMPDVNAAIGLAQMERAGSMRVAREHCARFYMDRLKGLSMIDVPLMHCQFRDHSWHLFPIILKSEARHSRNEMIRLLAERGIGTSVHYKPLHRMTYYRERYGLRAEDFHNAERIWAGTFSLPIYSLLTETELEYIVTTLWELIA
jgi:dTDP-4-amino-4,6-dideoxygalactose transaminase